MKNIRILILLTTIAVFSCSKEQDNEPGNTAVKSAIDAGMPGYVIQDMETDNKHNFYFVTWKSDPTVEHTEYSFPIRYYLSRKTSEHSRFEILDSNFVHLDKMIIDMDNNLWAIDYHTLFYRKNNKCDTIIKLKFDSGQGIFTCIAADKANNIWVGGLQTGLYKIDNSLNITRYTTANSDLPSNSMTSIYIDDHNNTWVALWDHAGMLKITGNTWTVYNTFEITTQAVWSVVSDKNDNIWIGKGWDNESEPLMRFDGSTWANISPQNGKNEIVTGTVRQLYSDNNRIYIMIESRENQFTQQLLTFDGIKWTQVAGLPLTDNLHAITDVKIDSYRHAAWISVSNKGIYKLKI